MNLHYLQHVKGEEVLIIPPYLCPMLPNSEFVKNALKMMTGTTAAQVVSFLASLLLARLYAPDNFGTLAIFMSSVLMISRLATLRYHHAIMLPKTDKDAANVFSLSILLVFITTLLTIIGIVLFGNYFIARQSDHGFVKVIYLIPVSVFLLGIGDCFYYWLSRQKRFGLLATTKFSQTLVGVSTQVLLGRSMQMMGLVLGWVVNHICYFGIQLVAMFRYFPEIWKATSWVNMKKMARTYSDFPLINSPHLGIDILQNEGLIFMIAYYFESAVLGWYAFANRILKTPIAMVANAITNVFYQKASADQQLKNANADLILSIYKTLFLIGLPFFTVLFFGAPWIFSFLFGEEWRIAGIIGQILVPWIFLHFMVAPVSQIPLVVDKQKEALLLSIVSLVFKFGSIYFGALSGEYLYTFILLSVTGSGLMLFTLWWYYSIAKEGK